MLIVINLEFILLQWHSNAAIFRQKRGKGNVM